VATYRVIEHDDGRLCIEAARSLPVEVRATPPDWVISSARIELGRIALGDVRDLAALLTRLLRADGARLATVAFPGRPDAALHRRILEGYLRERQAAVLERLDPRARRVGAAVDAVGAPRGRLVYAPALLDERWIVEDVVRFPPAAIALGHLDRLVDPPEIGDERACVDALRTWRGLFSPDGLPYRSLNRTLMQLPAGFSGELLCALRWVRLPRPVTDALELSAICIAAELWSRLGERALLHVALHARADEVVAAVARVAVATERRLSPRRVADLRVALRFLADYPGRCNGRLGGLVDRAVRWHRIAPDERTILAAAGVLDTPTRRPPVTLPATAGIRFLATVGEVIDEGERMGHCIASYASRAVAGRAYLFHVSHRGAEASIEVDARGRVQQAAGPANSTNPAVRWGSQVLGTWGRRLRPPPIGVAAPRRRRRTSRPADDRQLWLFPPA
jgi:hypothetical protein